MNPEENCMVGREPSELEQIVDQAGAIKDHLENVAQRLDAIFGRAFSTNMVVVETKPGEVRPDHLFTRLRDNLSDSSAVVTRLNSLVDCIDQKF